MSLSFIKSEMSSGKGDISENSAKLTIDASVKHQIFEGFGASSAWWSQDVGGWTESDKNGVPVREAIMELLYGRDSGIGIHIYRHNLPAGTGTGKKKGDFCHYWRSGQSFIDDKGNIDYSLDSNALWCLNKAIEMGVDDIVFFSNSAPDNMTLNGKPHGDKSPKKTTNLSPERYHDFADYVLNAVEYFLSKGVPITEVSPINEPQWRWQGGQEGCHFEPDEMAALYKVFYEEMEKRGLFDKVTLAMFESGQWGGSEFTKWFEAIMEDETLSGYIKTVQSHSYNSTENEKQKIADWLNKNYPHLKRSCTEWTEMRNLGKDIGMDSALDMANMICTDLTTLDAVSWSYWIAVSCYNWRDGLIYVDTDTHEYTVTKRLYEFGNFTKFITPGSVRVESNLEGNDIKAVTFENGNKLITVAVNASHIYKDMAIDVQGYTACELYLTDETNNLKELKIKEYLTESGVNLPPKSVMTIVMIK